MMTGFGDRSIWVVTAVGIVVLATVAILLSQYADIDSSADFAGETRSAEEGNGRGDDIGSVDHGESLEFAPAGDENPAVNPEGEERTPVHATVVPFSGQVTDEKTGNPVTRFTVLLEGFVEEKFGDVIHEVVEDVEGRFAFTVKPSDRYRFIIHSTSHCPSRLRGLKIPEKTGITDLQIALDPGFQISGRVVDDMTGRAVSGAIVGVLRFNSLYRKLSSGFPEGSNYTTTGDDGRFVVGGAKPQPDYGMKDHVVAAASHPEYAVASQMIKPAECGSIEFRLQKGFCLFGTVRDDEGQLIEGIRVDPYDHMSLLVRSVTSDGDGRFRTAPARRGKVHMRAYDPARHPRDPQKFTMEEKEVDVVDCDVQVDFGPTFDTITWRGKLLGLDSKSLADSTIKLTRAKAPRHDTKMLGWAQTDDEGRFAFHKLYPGAFEVGVKLPSDKKRTIVGIYEFSEPGIVEKDIQLGLTGGSVSGVVVYRSSGLPLVCSQYADWELKVNAYSLNGDDDRRRTTEVNRTDGTFRFENLEAGSYTVRCPFSEPISRVDVKNGSCIEGLRLIVMQTGNLCLNLHGFDSRERKDLGIQAYTAEGLVRDLGSAGRDKREVTTWRLTTGEYLLRSGGREMGGAQKSFVILQGKTTELSLDRSELSPVASNLEVHGRVLLADGRPVAGAALLFEPAGYRAKERVKIEATSGKEGAFTLSGLWSGLWKATCRTADGFTFRFSGVDIPSHAGSPFPLVLSVPSGCIRGTLVDGVIGSPVDTEDVDWLLRVCSPGGWIRASDLRQRGAGIFHIIGIPEGRYRLSAYVPGYKSYRSSTFELGKGEEIDLGKLALTPAGYLDLEVVDQSGLPVNRFFTYCDGVRLGSIQEDNCWISPNRRLFYNLSKGKLLIRVEAHGYDSEEKEIILQPGKRTWLQIVITKS